MASLFIQFWQKKVIIEAEAGIYLCGHGKINHKY